MNKSRDSFIFYRSFFEAVSELQDINKLEIYDAIFEYSLNFKEPELNGLSKTIFILIKPQLEANRKKFNNGAKGGRPSNKNKQKETKIKPKRNLSITKTKANVNDNVNVNDNYNVNNNVNSNENNNVNKSEILKMTGKTIEEVLQSDYTIEDKHKILTIRMMRQSNYDLSNSDLYKSCFKTVKKRYLNTKLL
jgi:hypothetical protein